VNGTLTGATEGKLIYAMEKKHCLLSYCQEHGYDPIDSYYYGDSGTDRHVMEAVGYPVAVSPDRRLLKNCNRQKLAHYGPQNKDNL